MSELLKGIAERMDAAMSEIALEVGEPARRGSRLAELEQRPDVFSRTCTRGSFEYRVTITERDVAKWGLEDVIKRSVDGAQRAVSFRSMKRWG